MIDLGERDHEQTESRTVAHGRPVDRRKMAARLVAALVAGLVLGAVGANELRDSRDERGRAARVALVAFPASPDGGMGSSSPDTLHLNAKLAVVNAGPAPVTIRAAEGQRPGVLVRDTGRSRLVRPGGTGWIDVELVLQCSAAFASEPVSIRFSVETEDGQVREARYPITLVGSAWQHPVTVTCQRLR